MTPIEGFIVQIFMQPGGSAAVGYTVSWAAENALNVAVQLAIKFVLPNSVPTTVTTTLQPGQISNTQVFTFPEGTTNFQLGART